MKKAKSAEDHKLTLKEFYEKHDSTDTRSKINLLKKVLTMDIDGHLKDETLLDMLEIGYKEIYQNQGICPELASSQKSGEKPISLHDYERDLQRFYKDRDLTKADAAAKISALEWELRNVKSPMLSTYTEEERLQHFEVVYKGRCLIREHYADELRHAQ